ncbi:DNA recombination protein RmuC [[Mycoplasma] mobile]|uniref:Expressed protein n=1 Tax=Mycoplasma mobile (strain ATCC 43663 / 163K / NCTC 11711) TaxID=267748 RepID=Q6KHB5_MYCM1|nr:DNA recombination protein RmuC [[Mycoplasma] mobile]AAT28015.1 expressed protein [Mycoplasma mobile 163K]
MKKISWFKRLFMSWEKFENYFKQSLSENADPNLMTRNQELETLRIELEKKLAVLNNSNESLVKQIENEKLNASDWKNQLIKNQENLKYLEASQKNLEEQKTNKQLELEKKNLEIENLRSKIINHENETENWRREISHKLVPLEKIQETFFGSWNKGKGELGELQLEQILIQSGLNKDNWISNLNVSNKIKDNGQNEKNVVEFALRSTNANKWIPIDSKVLEPSIIENEIFLDKNWISSLETQVKKISSLYLNKTYTESYGMLVIHNDLIYLKLYQEYPDVIKNAIEKHKVHILSPSTFIQFAWNLDNLLSFATQMEKGANLYKHVLSTFETLDKFTKKLLAVQKDFGIAMESHYPTLEKKQDKFKKLIDKDPILLEEINAIDEE